MEGADLENRLARMEAFEAIRQLIARYAIGADRKNDPAILGPLFSADGVWEAEDIGRYEGRDLIARELSGLASEFVTWSLHYMVSPLIEVDEDARHATCRWYLWELCTMKQEGGEAADTWYGGWYDSKLSVHDGEWLFDWVELSSRLASAKEQPWTGKATDAPTLPHALAGN